MAALPELCIQVGGREWQGGRASAGRCTSHARSDILRVPRSLSEGRNRALRSLFRSPGTSCGGHCNTRWACSSRRQESTVLPTVRRRQLCCNSGALAPSDPSFLPSLAGATNTQNTCACLHSWPQTARPSSSENLLSPSSAPCSWECRVSVLCADLEGWPSQDSGSSDAGTRAGRLCQWRACVRQGLRTGVGLQNTGLLVAVTAAGGQGPRGPHGTPWATSWLHSLS